MGMAGIYTPIPAYYKWVGDEGLTPRKDIKQGWAWMSMTGAFAALSAKHGLTAVQENNILDGDRGLALMLGMDQYDESKVTRDLGTTFYIDEFASKAYPGCTYTFSAIAGTLSLLRDEDIDVSQISRIDVMTSESHAIGFGDQEADSLADMQFNFPYQVAAAVVGRRRKLGPNFPSLTSFS